MSKGKPWTKKEEELLIKLYPAAWSGRRRSLAHRLNRTEIAIKRKAEKLGIKRNRVSSSLRYRSDYYRLRRWIKNVLENCGLEDLEVIARVEN